MSAPRSERDRKLAQWVLFHEAWRELSDLFESRGNTIEGAHQDAARCIERQLREGTLPSKTLADDEFFLRFHAPTLGREWPLGEAGKIPHEFWHHYFETRRRAHHDIDRGINHPLGEGDEANCGKSTFWFVSRQGWKEGGYMEGHASEVLLHRPSIEKLPKRRGERERGKGPDRYASAAARIFTEMNSKSTEGERNLARKFGVKREAALLKQQSPMTQLKSIEDQLRRRIRELQAHMALGDN